MGLLINGEWHDQWYDTETSGGRFEREASQFRHWVSAERGARFQAERDRYHLYVSLACPWSCRGLLVRNLKGLQDTLGLSVAHWHMGARGWTFDGGPGCTGDRLYGLETVADLYVKAKPDYSGRATLPVLWDREGETIVSNESADIMRMLNSQFDLWGDGSVDFYPEPLRADIDVLNRTIYERVNNGVYKAGFATNQEAYEEAYDALFATLTELDARLANQRYLAGSRITEADWRLFVTLVRFDPVYYGHFKCNQRALRQFPALWAYMLDLYQTRDVAETVNLYHIKHHYYTSHKTINPTGIVPKGPQLDLGAPHGRERLG